MLRCIISSLLAHVLGVFRVIYVINHENKPKRGRTNKSTCLVVVVVTFFSQDLVMLTHWHVKLWLVKWNLLEVLLYQLHAQMLWNIDGILRIFEMLLWPCSVSYVVFQWRQQHNIRGSRQNPEGWTRLPWAESHALRQKVGRHGSIMGYSCWVPWCGCKWWSRVVPRACYMEQWLNTFDDVTSNSDLWHGEASSDGCMRVTRSRKNILCSASN